MHLRRIADEGDTPQSEGVRAVDGVALRQIPGSDLCVVEIYEQRVAGVEVGTGIVPGVVDTKGIGMHGAKVRGVRIFAGDVGDALTMLIHGRIGPVTVEAEHRDGVENTLITFGSGNRLRIDKAFHIRAVCVAFVHSSHIIRVKLDVGNNGSLAGSRNNRGSVSSCNTVHGPFHCRTNLGGEGMHVVTLSGLVGVYVVSKRSLGEHLGGERIGELCVGEVVDGEGNGVLTGSGRIVAELCLHLTVSGGIGGGFVHENVGLSLDSCGTRHATALVMD